MATLQERDIKHIWHPCSQMKDYEEFPPIPIKSGKGVWLYGYDGKAYLDIISSWWCNLLGHCCPQINEAVTKQLESLEHVIFANFTHEPAIKLCEELAVVVPHGLNKYNFSDNGSAAVECALKMSFQYQFQTGHPEKKRFMCLSGGYHGETIGALSVGALDLYARMYRPMLLDTVRIEAPDCYRCLYGRERGSCACECFAAAEETFERCAHECCAVIIEPLLQGSAGMKMYPPAYIKKLRGLCDKFGILLIVDEIATGFGRTGKMFACEHAEVSPDIMCISKGLTGGYMPMAATVTTDRVYDAFYDDYAKGRAFMHSHTYSGNPLGCAAALAVQKLMREGDILNRAAVSARSLNAMLREAFDGHPNVGEIRSIGLINAIELVKNRETKEPLDSAARTGYQIYKKALDLGLLLRPLGDVIYFNPPLTITEAECAKAVSMSREAVSQILPSHKPYN